MIRHTILDSLCEGELKNANITITSDNGDSDGIIGHEDVSATSKLIVKDSYLPATGVIVSAVVEMASHVLRLLVLT